MQYRPDPLGSSNAGSITLAQAWLSGALWLLPVCWQDWYVDVDAPGCAIGTGSQSNPFCSIQEAIDSSFDGDTIHVAGGSYFENLLVTKDVLIQGGGMLTVLDGSASGTVVRVEESLVVLMDLQVTNGLSTRGGGISIDSDSDVTLVNTLVEGNTVQTYFSDPFCVVGSGAGIASDGALTLVNSAVAGNNAVGSCSVGGPTLGYFSDGGGISSSGTLTLLNSTVSGNTASGYGGGVSHESNLGWDVVESTISENAAPMGAGISSHFGALTVVNTTIRDNHATALGGGIEALESPITLKNTLISNNAANSTDGEGGGVRADDSPLVLINTTVVNNTAAQGGGIYSYAYDNEPVIAENSILHGNLPNSLTLLGTETTVRYSLVEGGWFGPGNIDADPVFTDPMNSDYRLLPGSPCIDAGDNQAVPLDTTTDLIGVSRFLDHYYTPDTGIGMAPIVDMGAYETRTLWDSSPTLPGMGIRR